jgi:hypothetical protein
LKKRDSVPRIFSASFRLFQITTAAAIFLSAFFACSAVADSVDSELLALKSTGRAFVRISRNVTPSVVNIRTFRVKINGYSTPDLETFKSIF